MEFEDRIQQIALIPSGNGVFEVTVNGTRVFSKARLGRHAVPGELVSLVGARLSDG